MIQSVQLSFTSTAQRGHAAARASTDEQHARSVRDLSVCAVRAALSHPRGTHALNDRESRV
eukprot:1288013-Prymnesium_polylepis.2